MDVLVKLVDGENCFVAIPPGMTGGHLDSSVHGDKIVNLKRLAFTLNWYDDSDLEQKAKVGWDGRISSPVTLPRTLSTSDISTKPTVEMSKRFAECLGLWDGAEATLSKGVEVEVVLRAEVEPVSVSDWELLERHPYFLETQILNQLSIMSLNQVIPLSLPNSAFIRIKVLSIICEEGNSSSKQFGALLPESEIHVAPRVRQKTSQEPTHQPPLSISLRRQSFPFPLTPSLYTRSVFVTPRAFKLGRWNNREVVVLSFKDHNQFTSKESGREAPPGVSPTTPTLKRTYARVSCSPSILPHHVAIDPLLAIELGCPIGGWVDVCPIRKRSKAKDAACAVRSLGLKRVCFRVNDSSSVSDLETGPTGDVSGFDQHDLQRHWEQQDDEDDEDRDQKEGEERDEGEERVEGMDGNPSSQLQRKCLRFLKRVEEEVGEKKDDESLGIPVSNGSMLCLAPKGSSWQSLIDKNRHCFVLWFNGNSSLEQNQQRTEQPEKGPNRTKNGGRGGSLPPLFFLSSSLLQELFSQKQRDGGVMSDFVLPNVAEIGVSWIDTPLAIPNPCLVPVDPSLRKKAFEHILQLLAVPHHKILSVVKESLRYHRQQPQQPQQFSNFEEKELVLSTDISMKCHLVVSGPHGSGKSTFVKGVCSALQYGYWAHPIFELPEWCNVLPKVPIHTEFISCRGIANMPIGRLTRLLHRRFALAANHAPSVIVLDDVDLLVPHLGDGEEKPASLRSLQIGEYLSELMKKLVFGAHRVCVLSTVLNLDGTHSSLCRPSIFAMEIPVRFPTAPERASIISNILLSSSTPGPALYRIEKMEETEKERNEPITEGRILTKRARPSPDLLRFGKTCEGYVPRDLEHLIQRALHASASRIIESLLGKAEQSSWGREEEDGEYLGEREVSLEDFEKARANFCPISLKGVSGSKKKEKELCWEDVGGLDNIRRAARETYEWPLKYPELFEDLSKSGKAFSSMLLYGPPGCGKTMVANVIAQEYQDLINFVPVKGPELLNKYIGASEAAVRDVFEKAGSAQPCILFFDEFDAIAPKRGHDNTGVTDRVVNQLLTEMDGVGNRSGVFVLAASSRPDLIDAALLRPGRLDKSVYCGMPNLDERVGILNAVARKMRLAPNVDLRSLASRCSNYTGADLQALMYNAQLDAVHDVLEKASEKEEEEEEEEEFDPKKMLKQESVKEGKESEGTPLVTVRHIENSFETTRPSLSSQELSRFDRIYESFVEKGGGGKGGGQGATLEFDEKRVSLA